jgi:hypothetical protein
MLLIPAPGRLRWEDPEFKASLMKKFFLNILSQHFVDLTGTEPMCKEG